MSSSSSEASSADSDSDATAQLPPQRGTTLVSKRKDAFEPPQGAVLVGGPDDGTGAIETGEFDWDSVKDDDVELWLVRVPDSIKPRHLNDAVFDAPSSSSTHTLGQVKRKHETYDLWSLGDRDESDVDREQVGGDEMKGLCCLLPRKSKDGKLYIGPKPITRRLVLAASPPTPSAQDPVVLHQNPPRHSYPSERFKHRYTPYGSSTLPPLPPLPPTPTSTMEVDHEGDDDDDGASPTTTTPKPKKRSRLAGDLKKPTRRSKLEKP